MSTLVVIFRLTVFTTILTISLIAFALLNQHQAKEISMMCGTVDMPICGNAVSTELLDHPGERIFLANCRSCHSLDRKLVGPPLRYSFQRRDSVWFVKMILNPTALVKGGDTAAVNLFNQYYQIEPTQFTDFTPQEIADLVEYLKLEGERDLTVY